MNSELRRLDAYRCALELYRCLGRIIEALPRTETELRAQLKRSRLSIPFNIGEGVGKRGKARAAAYEVSLGETKEVMVALDCIQIDELAPATEVQNGQDLSDRIAAMLTNMIRSTRLPKA